MAHLQPGDVPPGGKGLAEYLAKYVVSPPISVRRLEEYDGQQVSYWYEDHKTQAIQHATLPVLRFIGRMVQHILPKGFQRIRYFGLHSHPRYQAIREQLATLLPTSRPAIRAATACCPAPPSLNSFSAPLAKTPCCALVADADGVGIAISSEIWHFEGGTTLPGRASRWTNRIRAILPWLQKMLREIPWQPASHWYNYHCRSCDHRDWVEDIIVDGFPPDGTRRMPCADLSGMRWSVPLGRLRSRTRVIPEARLRLNTRHSSNNCGRSAAPSFSNPTSLLKPNKLPTITNSCRLDLAAQRRQDVARGVSPWKTRIIGRKPRRGGRCGS